MRQYRHALGMTVCEIARLTGVTPDVVRYYVRIGLLNPARDPENGYRLFNSADERRLRFIRLAQQAGCALQDIRLLLSAGENGRLEGDWLRELLVNRLMSTRRKRLELERRERSLEHALKSSKDWPVGNGGVEDLQCWLQAVVKSAVP